MSVTVTDSATFTSQLMSNHTTKMTQVPIEINENLNFSQNWYDKTPWNYTHNFKCQNVSILNFNVSINQHPSNFNLQIRQNLSIIFLPKCSVHWLAAVVEETGGFTLVLRVDVKVHLVLVVDCDGQISAERVTQARAVLWKSVVLYII